MSDRATRQKHLLRDLAIVVGSMSAVVVAAIVQHKLVLKVDPRPAALLIPAFVGLGFGFFLRRFINFREEERILRQELEERGETITALNHDLEAKVEARTRALQQKEAELLQAQKMEALGRLAGGVAHDFNNLLTSIIGGASILDQIIGDDDEDAIEVLAEIQLATERATRLTRQLLTMSQKQVLNREVLQLSNVAQTMVPVLRRLLTEDIELKVDFEGCGPVWADRSQMEQLLLNLCVNARDAVPAGGEVRIEVKPATPEELPDNLPRSELGYCRLTVRDTGTGIDADVMAHIFDPFFTTKKVGEGTGLGLSVVRGIVERAGGSVVVDSKTGEGTVFHVFIPITDREPKVEPARQLRTSRIATERVLLIEDDASVRRVIRHVLAPAGYRLVEAASGDEAIAIAESHTEAIDLILTDVIMPGRSGPDAVEEIAEFYPGAKVLFMTGYPGNEIESRIGRALNAPVLHKPFDAHQLLAAVREVLEKGEATEKGATGTAAP